MAEKSTTILGIYPYYSSVEHAVQALKEAGFRNTNISVVFPRNAGSMNFARELTEKPPEDVLDGGITGAVVGGTLGWLAGVRALAIPGLGPVIAAGPIMASLASVDLVGTSGGITGALMGMEIPENVAQRYQDRVRDGGILASVLCDDSIWTQRAQEIMERSGAQDITSTGGAIPDYARSGGPHAQSAPGSVGV
ncbi:MAG TPA: DUF3341 domain-containing protein [Terriglobia bacterium]|nr:DUF3341 domain-containing protein [Terriglobia bacterium]